MQKAIAQI